MEVLEVVVENSEVGCTSLDSDSGSTHNSGLSDYDSDLRYNGAEESIAKTVLREQVLLK